MQLKARERLAVNLADTSKAYGYTLCVWGSGAVLINAYGLPDTLGVMAYIVGAVTGFALLSLAVFGALFEDVETLEDQQLLVAAMIHYVAAPVTVGIAALLTMALSADWAWFVVGVNATLAYNIMLLVETALYEELRLLEDALLKRQTVGIGGS